MPGSAYHRLGETVTLQFHLPMGLTFSSSVPVPIALYDATGKPRTLLPGEQINLDTMFLSAFDNSTTVPYQIEIDAGPSTATYPGGITVAHLSMLSFYNEFDPSPVPPVAITYPAPEGFPLPVGYPPLVQLKGVASTSTLNLDISGAGRIATVVDPPGYKTWQAGTTPGQTVGRNF